MAVASPPAVQGTLLDRLVAATQDRLAVLGQRRAEGLNTLDWRLGVQAVLKDSHIAAAALAKGGFDNLDKRDFGVISGRLRSQYDYLSGLALDTRPGEFGAQDMARLAMYGAAPRGTYADMNRREAIANSAEQVRNVLGDADHCDECLAETAAG